MPPAVSVVIPTYHRPELLGHAVRSVLRQSLPGRDFEVIIAVSDAASVADQAAAEVLARDDPRVRVTVADRLGPGAARNAGIAGAGAPAIAFLDDDCEAAPGWLEAGLARLDAVDLVQGRTLPAAAPPARRARTLWIDHLSYLWEACNLFVRRDLIERAGGFDADWNPTGRPGRHIFEDTEWGWRLVRAGARYAFEPDALVNHGVFARSLAEWLESQWRLRYFPLMVRTAPDVRARFHRRYFITRRHLHLSVGAALLAVGAAARVAGARRLGAAVAGAGAVGVLSPLRFKVAEAVEVTVGEAVELSALVYGSIRWRRLVL